MEPLTDDEIAEYGRRLTALRAELQRTLAGGEERARPVELTTAQGRVSRVDAMQQQQMALAEQRRIQARLRGVEQALKRVAEGEYGECGRCGGGIDRRRLEVRPEGPLCVPCTRALGG